MKSKAQLSVILVCLCFFRFAHADTQCAGGTAGSGNPSQNTVLIVWAKPVDDNSVFPNWSNVILRSL